MYERMLDKKAEPSMPELVAHCGICGDMFAVSMVISRRNSKRKPRFAFLTAIITAGV